MYTCASLNSDAVNINRPVDDDVIRSDTIFAMYRPGDSSQISSNRQNHSIIHTLSHGGACCFVA